MPPSNQLAYDSQSHDEVLSSPLEELSQNTIDNVKKPKNTKGKRKLEVKEFPMDVDAIKSSLISKRSTENNLAPFPVSPPRKVKTSYIPKETELAPFPMEIPSEKQPSTSSHNHMSLQSSVLSYDGLRPFPMTLPSKPEIKDFPMSVNLRVLQVPFTDAITTQAYTKGIYDVARPTQWEQWYVCLFTTLICLDIAFQLTHRNYALTATSFCPKSPRRHYEI